MPGSRPHSGRYQALVRARPRPRPAGPEAQADEVTRSAWSAAISCASADHEPLRMDCRLANSVRLQQLASYLGPMLNSRSNWVRRPATPPG
jgi:hypothetical protein